MAALQRLLSVVDGERTHADCHQAAVGPCDSRCLEWPLFEVHLS
jgi:hypothetical protein